MDILGNFGLYLMYLLFNLLLNSDDKGMATYSSERENEETPLICPNSTNGCRCFKSGTEIKLSCFGPLVTQQGIDEFIIQTRKVNSKNISDNQNQSEGQPLRLKQFLVSTTSLVELDLTQLQLASSDIQNLGIFINSNLTRIFSSSSSSSTIVSKNIMCMHNQLDDSGLAGTLKLFDSKKVKSLVLSNNKIAGSGQKHVEFLPGLSKLINLKTLHLSSNSIKILAGGQFRTNSRLTELLLDQNPVDKVGVDAFLIERGNQAFEKKSKIRPVRYLIIDLTNCTLTDEKMSGNFCGNQKEQNIPVEIQLRGNQFEFLGEEKFLPFLTKNSENTLKFDYNLKFSQNPFKCDERMRWLKAAKLEFEPRVHSVDCINDQGKTIFKTDLV